ncbi:MAG: OmpA family protein [Gammaproteobacteria bacterium]|nr:OmpA family protein [Gammaproteobacteria bacterium]
MHTTFKLTAISCMVLTGFATSGQAKDFDNRYYLGFGLGMSNLEPETNNSGYSVEDKNDAAGKLYLGMDFAKHWGAELYYADLGAASLENENVDRKGDIDYKVFGLSALYHFYNNHGSEGMMNRSGWDWFAKAGIGSLDNSSDLPFKKQKGTHVMLGLGTEYEWQNGFAVRLEGETFDKDAQLISLGLLKRFGGERSEPLPPPAPIPEPMPEPEPVIEVAPEPVPVIIEAPEPLDTDSDGVADEADLCPATAPGTVVNKDGCDAFNGVLEGVQFESGSARLTSESMLILDDVAEQLKANPTVQVAVMAHTDNTGAAQANLELSKQRSISVVRYLMGKGIQGNRMRPEAYGESQPRASNATPEGRFANRRVEFKQLD